LPKPYSAANERQANNPSHCDSNADSIRGAFTRKAASDPTANSNQGQKTDKKQPAIHSERAVV
jgi:hypothetical protein